MLGRLIRRLRALLNRSALDRELDEELGYHLEREIEQNVRGGMDLEEARRAAMRTFGGLEQSKEECREARGVRFIEDVWQDLRYGLRMLSKKPSFTFVAVITLALGIGSSTAIFSAVNSVLFKQLPYPHAERIMALWDFGSDGSRLYVTFGTYRELVERSHSFDALAVMRPWQPTITGTAEPERLEGQRVSADYFRVLGATPAIGRNFTSAEDETGGPRVAIISDGLWRKRFGGDAAIIGRQITLDGNAYTVLGVMPSTFENLLAPSAEVWTPLQYDKSLLPQSREWGHHLRMTGRLREGVSLEQARQEIITIGRNPVQEFARPPYAALSQGLIVSPLRDDLASDARPALLSVLGAVLLVLLIACVNVTNLLLARGAQRRGEFAMRAALGATRRRLIQQQVTESLLLAVTGGALGLLLAEFGVDALVSLSPPKLPRASAIVIDGTVFAFAFGITTLVGLLVGLVPALHTTRSDLQHAVQQSSQRTTVRHQLTRRMLVVSEIALALVLLVSAGLLLHSLERLFSVHPGFDATHLLTMQVQVAGTRFDNGATHRFFAQSLEAVRQVPGVSAAAFTSQLPMSGELEDGYGVHFESSPTGNPEADNGALRYAVTPGYFETMDIPLRRGRLLGAGDVAAAPAAVLISESLARSKFPGQDPVGQRLQIGPNDGPWFTIVGVVGDVKQTSLAVSQTDAVYVTTEQWQLFTDRALWLVVRARGDAAGLAPAVRSAIWSVDKDQPVVRVATMNDLLAASAAERRFALILFETFGLAALMLSAIGIYGVLSGSVAERTREIGVRIALGASRADILKLVMRQGMALTFLGIALGIWGSALASKAIVSLLFDVSRLDLATYLSVVALLASVSAIACYMPAWRAARVDPSITLRAE